MLDCFCGMQNKIIKSIQNSLDKISKSVITRPVFKGDSKYYILFVTMNGGKNLDVIIQRHTIL